MARLSLYRTYRFIDKDPVIDKIRTILQDEGLLAKGQRKIVHQLSGVAVGTLDGLFEGDTKCPINRTVCAIVTSVGYEPTFVKVKDIDIDKELKRAADWLLKQNSSPKEKTSARKINGRTR